MPRLCKTCSENDRWLPVPVEAHRAFLSKLIQPSKHVPHAEGLKSNLAYNLQYLEYLNYTLEDLRLTSVLWTITVKNFLIVGTSIVEALFYFVLRNAGLHRENAWSMVRKVSTNEFIYNNRLAKIENMLYEKLDEPIEEEMNFDAMLKKVEARKMLGNDESLYKGLKYLRRLRNRIHLQLLEKNLDTDWHNFNSKELLLTKRALHAVLGSSLFNASSQELEPYRFLLIASPNPEQSN